MAYPVKEPQEAPRAVFRQPMFNILEEIGPKQKPC